MKKKILIDLDVITTGRWDKKGEKPELARRFMERVEGKEFEVVTPFILLEMVAKWRYQELKDSIEEFYLKNTDRMLTNEDLDRMIENIGIDDEKVLLELEKENIKDEDALLALVASIFGLDYLTTLNRKHLRGKETEINEILKKYKLRTIQIVYPDEL